MVNFLKGLVNFFKLITGNIIGLLIGLIVAVIVIIILQATAYKNGKVNGIVAFVLCLVFAVSGIFIQAKFFTQKEADVPSPTEQVERIDKTISSGWNNTNGGFDYGQIITAQKDDNCPELNDQIIKLTCHDFGSYVCFSYKNKEINQNILFVKGDNGLFVDGLLNVHAYYKKTYFSMFTPAFMRWNIDLNSFKWVDERINEIKYKQTGSFPYGILYDNLVSCSSEKASFLDASVIFGYANYKAAAKLALEYASTLTGQNAVDNFIKFGDIELIGTKDSAIIKVNSFYNYLYDQVKGINYGTKKIIDGTSTLCLPIPTELQKNYPISESEQIKYATDPADLTTAPKYYGVYRVNIAIELEFLKGNSILTKTTNMEEYVEKISKDDKTKDRVVVENVESNNNFSLLKINFENSKSSDISNINLSKYPINIQLTCNELNVVKNIRINDITKLENGIDCVLNKNVTWKYVIDSPELIFEDYIGTFKIESNNNNIQFDYYYLQNYVLANIGLNPVGTIDETIINLKDNPVKIILQNDKHTYQFIIDDNSKLHELQTMLVEVGEYNYTILSKQLIFTVTGKLNITTTDRTMLFNYCLNLDSEDMKFALTVTASSGTNNKFQLYAEASNVTIIRDSLGLNKTYNVNCYIYDKDGKLLEKFEHTHSSTGNCNDTWTATNLTAGNRYIVQLSFVDASDSTKTYLSDYAEFEFNSNTTYKLTYTVEKNV